MAISVTFSLEDYLSVTKGVEELEGYHGSPFLVFLTILSGTWEWEVTELERRDEVGPFLFHN